MSKLNNFVNNLAFLLSTEDRDVIKDTIGDSTTNNRTVTVNQLVRYLSATFRFNAADNVSSVYQALHKRLTAQRLRSNKRTDAFDVNEFLTVLTNVATKGSPVVKQSLSKVIY